MNRILGSLLDEPRDTDLDDVVAKLPAAFFLVQDEGGGLLMPCGLSDRLGLDDPSPRRARIEEVVEPPHLGAAMALLAREEPAAGEFAASLRLSSPRGAPIDVLATARRVPHSDGGSTPLLAFMAAVDGHEEEERLRHRERLLEETERIVHMGSWSWDIVDDRVTWSDELCRMYGHEPGELEVSLTTVIERTVDADRDYLRTMIDRGLATQLPFTYSHRIRHSGGDVRVLHGRACVTEVDGDGRPRAMVGVCQDVTSQQHLRDEGEQFRELYERERQVAVRLREVDELKDALVAAVSHDLRTPLAVILGSAGTLRDHAGQLDEDTARALLDNTIDHANRLHSMLSDLLDLDRLRRGEVRPKYRPTALRELVRDALRNGGYDTSRVELVEWTDEVIADVDAPKIERIVENLVRNALRHTPVDASVWVRVDADDDWATITVADNGPGVPERLRERIFEAFERGSATTIAPSGSGLGLAIVKRFARLHGGSAWVDDREGGGAAFHARIPLRHG